MCDKTFVFWYSSLEKHHCGYCKNERGNISHGMWAKYLTVEDYQNLIDRGWRRSGHYCYKPLMDQICCPMYTIRCDALNFQLSKSQKKVIKKFNKFLKDGSLNPSENHHDEPHGSDGVSEFFYREAPTHLLDKGQISDDEISKVNSDEANNLESVAGVSQINDAKLSDLKTPKTGVGADPSKPPCKKAKVLRKERRQEKLLKRGMSLEKIPVKNEQKTLEEFLNEVSDDHKHKFKITLERIDPNHKHFKLTADLFTKYQIFVHNESPDDCDESQYISFLIDTPLQYVRFSKDSELGFGSFHQLYWLDDKLIAVGVIDILPKCVSAVYFFYDPDYRSLTLGTYGSSREVEFSRSLHQKIPSIRYYYMGFYIHSCPKMRYKGKLTPSFLLCPETYHWVPIEKSIPKLEVSKYSKLEDDDKASDENACTSQDVDAIKIWYNRSIVLFKQYKRRYGEEDLYNTIGQLIGKKCAKSIIFISDN